MIEAAKKIRESASTLLSKTCIDIRSSTSVVSDIVPNNLAYDTKTIVA